MDLSGTRGFNATSEIVAARQTSPRILPTHFLLRTCSYHTVHSRSPTLNTLSAFPTLAGDAHGLLLYVALTASKSAYVTLYSS